jgi:hypothetical protein
VLGGACDGSVCATYNSFCHFVPVALSLDITSLVPAPSPVGIIKHETVSFLDAMPPI